MGTCCIQVLKCLFLFVNIFFFIVGATMVGLGIWILASKSVFIPVLQSVMSSFNSLVYIFIVVGAFTMFLAVWGILGFFCGKQFVLILYVPLLLLIFLLHLFPGILLHFQQKMIDQVISNNVINLIKYYNPMDEANQTQEVAWDYAQFHLSCCGWTGPENWQNNTFFRDKLGTYPCSCSNRTASFQTMLGVCTLPPISHKVAVDNWPLKNQGCNVVVQTWVKKAVDNILLVSAITAVSEILGISLSFFFCMGGKCIC